MKKEFNINFIKKFPIFLAISLIIIIAGLASIFFLGVNVDIMFKGGTIVTYSYTDEIDFNAISDVVTETISHEGNVTGATDVNGNSNFVITLSGSKNITIEQQKDLTDALKEKFADNKIEKVEDVSVNATTGFDFFLRSIVAVLLAFVFLLFYIGIRFRRIGGWSAGLCGIIAIFHDVLIVFITCILFGFVIGDGFIAVVLTILGYSLNDTIVIFDRIRENNEIHSGKITMEECANMSINQTLSRTINTAITTVISMIIVSVVAVIFNVDTIISFAVPLVTGMIAGVYSTVCFAAPLWVLMQKKNHGKKA